MRRRVLRWFARARHLDPAGKWPLSGNESFWLNDGKWPVSDHPGSSGRS